MGVYVLLIIAIVGVILLWKKFRKGGCCLGSILKGLFIISLVLLGLTLVIGVGAAIFEGLEEKKEEQKREEAEQIVDAFLEENRYLLDADWFGVSRDDLVDMVMEDPDLLNDYRESISNGELDDIYVDSGVDPDSEKTPFWRFIGDLFTFHFQWWILIPLGIAIVIAIIGCSKFEMDGEVGVSVLVYGFFISVVLLAILNWQLLLSVVTVVAFLAAIGLTVGYLLPPVFKELPILLSINSEPKKIGEEGSNDA